MHEQLCLNKDRSFVMLAPSIRLCSVLCSKAPECFSTCWQIAPYSYMSSYMALQPQIWNCLVPPDKFQALVFNCFVFLLIFRKIDWHALESARVLSQLCSACCVLGAGCGFCVNTLFGTPGGTPSSESRCLKLATSWTSPLMTCLRSNKRN
jgi:hypothetical protein